MFALRGKLFCYTTQLKYVFRLEENALRVVGQNLIIFWPPQGNNNKNFQLERDQVVLLETAANLWATRLKANDFFAVFSSSMFLSANIEGLWKQNSLLYLGSVIKWLLLQCEWQLVCDKATLTWKKMNIIVKTKETGRFTASMPESEKLVSSRVNILMLGLPLSRVFKTEIKEIKSHPRSLAFYSLMSNSPPVW